MPHISDEPREAPSLLDLPAPGPERRRMLRAAGINLHIEDFTTAEQIDRGFLRGGAL